MTEQELRALVREAIVRRLGTGVGPDLADSRPPGDIVHVGPDLTDTRPYAHTSHGLLPLARGSDGDGACLIEPAVRCNHCGYCLSLGH